MPLPLSTTSLARSADEAGTPGRLAMRSLLAAIILAVAPDLAAAAPDLEATLAANIDKDGKAHAELTLTNHSKRNICFFDDNEASMQRSDGSILGNPMIIDYAQPNAVDVVWIGDMSQHFQVSFNPLQLVLNSDEAAHAAKVTVDFEAFDCVELLSSSWVWQKAKPRYKLTLTAIPTKDLHLHK